MQARKATFARKTGETEVSVQLTLDGTGQYKIDTGNGMLDHLLAQLARHGLLDLEISAKGDVATGWHHTVEDVAIALGRALHEALGDGKGITRIAHFVVPMDEALALAVVDLSGRGYAVVDTGLSNGDLEMLPPDLIRHFLETFALEARITLHAEVMYGTNDHHKAEALFKALARALREAISLDQPMTGEIPSTKGVLG
ncbi:MAG: imidazoleglycerol-phosphate dehydratase HisB [Chloroflexi bacterium]|nr:imidazoleglycerol-phosphate dehydratase HisB [Chloroflexota bacterium]